MFNANSAAFSGRVRSHSCLGGIEVTSGDGTSSTKEGYVVLQSFPGMVVGLLRNGKEARWLEIELLLSSLVHTTPGLPRHPLHETFPTSSVIEDPPGLAGQVEHSSASMPCHKGL